MPSQRGTSWQGIVYHSSLPGERARRNFPTKKEAAAWEAESKARLIRGEPICMGEGAKQASSRKAGVPYTLLELVEHVGASRWAAKASGSRQKRNAEFMSTLIGAHKPISSITKVDIERARGELLRQGNSPSTVNKKVAALSTLLTEALESGIIETKPKCSKFSIAEHRIRRFTPTEEAKGMAYFERAGVDWMSDYIALSLDTGLRQGELLQLRFQDVDSRVVKVWGTGAKSGKNRSVPLTGRAKGILERRARLVDHPQVFEGVSRYVLDDQWQRFRAEMGLMQDGEFVPHVLRHEFCSRLADRGLNAAVIKELAGHSTLAITQRYIHIQADQLVNAINALENHTGI